ncbi:MAG TPA: TIGR04283 family arsenosugar biosynthesis glycosyltransferase [Thermoanaerobaculia bacterium]|nr:TIGR04283 family arsenosugar biosynthesis glycosyltransferase [Thermoanaerobaculia bacterium]
MRLAVVVPVLDEEVSLGRTLDSVRQVLEHGDLLVVSDGGSADGTVAIAEGHGAVVVRGAPGRGEQLQRGAREALRLGARALLFVHADTLLPQEARAQVMSALERGAAGGGFTVAFDGARGRYRLGERIVNARTRALRVPLGDQAQFASAEAFAASGGFPDWPILEDVELMRRLRRVGPIAVLEPPVITSTRRFERRGTLRTVATNWLIWLLYRLGVSPHRLARLYQQAR